MVSEAAPFMEDFLFCNYEGKRIRKPNEKSLMTAQKFGNIFDLIDELTATDEDREFEKDLNETYFPKSWKKEKAPPFEACFLYIDVKNLDKSIG